MRPVAGAPAPTAHPHRWAMLCGAWLIYFCFGLVAAGTAPLVQPIVRDLGLSASQMGSVFGAWQLVYIAAAMPCGAFLDRVGPRRALLLAALIIALSGALRGLAGSHVELFLAVALFGIGGPLISVGAPKVIALWFDGAERGLAMGLYMTGPALGNIAALSLTNAMVMPLLGGSWRSVLVAYGVAALVSGVVWLAIAAHPASRAMERRLAGEPKRRQIQVFAELARTPAVQIMLVMGLGIFFINHGFTNWLPEMLRHIGMDAASAGYWASLPVVAGILGSLLIPRLATPPRRLPILFVLFLAAAMGSLLLHASSPWPLTAGLILQGIARGSMMTVAVLTLVELRGVGAHKAGAASGLFFSAAEVGGFTGPLTVGLLYDASGSFAPAFDAMVVTAGLLMLLLVPLRRLQRANAG